MAAEQHPTSVRMDPDVKAALTVAARDDERSVSSFMNRILRGWLVQHGYLPKSKPKPGVRRPNP
jgi:hypothetical protein